MGTINFGTYPSNLPIALPPTSPSTSIIFLTPPSFYSPLFCACAPLHHFAHPSFTLALPFITNA